MVKMSQSPLFAPTSVQPESKDKYGALQFLMHVWVGGKTLLTRAITEHLRGEFLSV